MKWICNNKKHNIIIGTHITYLIKSSTCCWICKISVSETTRTNEFFSFNVYRRWCFLTYNVERNKKKIQILKIAHFNIQNKVKFHNTQCCMFLYICTKKISSSILLLLQRFSCCFYNPCKKKILYKSCPQTKINLKIYLYNILLPIFSLILSEKKKKKRICSGI